MSLDVLSRTGRRQNCVGSLDVAGLLLLRAFSAASDSRQRRTR